MVGNSYLIPPLKKLKCHAPRVGIFGFSDKLLYDGGDGIKALFKCNILIHIKNKKKPYFPLLEKYSFTKKLCQI